MMNGRHAKITTNYKPFIVLFMHCSFKLPVIGCACFSDKNSMVEFLPLYGRENFLLQNDREDIDDALYLKENHICS